MSIMLYGISSCDTVKKARRWLEGQTIAYRFHDVRLMPLEATLLQRWLKTVGEERLINRRGTTWRQLTDTAKQLPDDAARITLLQTHPTVMKRPVLEGAGLLLVGFSETDYAASFTAKAA